MKIWFDMDGTIADLYGVTDWLPALIAEDTRPYEIAKGIGNLALIARLLNKAQANGHEIGIISWTAKAGTAGYNARIYAAKVGWLGKHLPSVNWDTIPAGINHVRVGEGVCLAYDLPYVWGIKDMDYLYADAFTLRAHGSPQGSYQIRQCQIW